MFSRPYILFGESIRISLCVCLSICVCFKLFLSDNRSPLLVERSSSHRYYSMCFLDPLSYMGRVSDSVCVCLSAQYLRVKICIKCNVYYINVHKMFCLYALYLTLYPIWGEYQIQSVRLSVCVSSDFCPIGLIYLRC